MQTYINSVISTRDKEFTEIIKIVMNAHKYSRMYNNNASKYHKDMKQDNMNDHDEHHEHMCCCRL